MHEQESRLLEHLLNIVDLITQELKEVKGEANKNDKQLALIDHRLHAAEKIIEEIKQMQNIDRIETAKTRGGDIVKWAIIGTLSTGFAGLLFKIAYDIIQK